MQDAILLVGRRIVANRRMNSHSFCLVVDNHPPQPIKKTEDAVNPVHVPRLHLLERAHKHFVEAKRISPVFRDDRIGIDDVTTAL